MQCNLLELHRKALFSKAETYITNFTTLNNNVFISTIFAVICLCTAVTHKPLLSTDPQASVQQGPTSLCTAVTHKPLYSNDPHASAQH